MCFCVYFLNFSALISGYLQIYISDSFSLCKLFLCVCSSSTEIKSTIKYIQTLAAGCQGQNQEKVKESEGERERERPSVSFSLSLSLAPGRPLEITIIGGNLPLAVPGSVLG